MLAKSCFDLREYRECAHSLKNSKSNLDLFLRYYSTLLAIQSQQAYTDHTNITEHNTDELAILLDDLLDIKEKDAFLLYLTGCVLLELKRKDAVEYLIDSVLKYPCNWSAWLALGTTITTVDKFEEIFIKIPSTFISQCFKIKVFNNLYQKSQDVEPLINSLLMQHPSQFLNVEKAVLYHNNRGILF